LTDRIFTRVGASDDLTLAQSTFMVEMIEVASIIHNATAKSLLILDEIGRGTSTYDGLSIAWSVMEYVSEVIKAKTLFATHYHELTELEGKLAGVKNYRVLVNEHGESVVFLHRIARGGANKSFGIEVAALAGVPAAVTKRAKEIAKSLEMKDNKDTNGILVNSMGAKRHEQISLFNSDSSGVKEILKVLKDTVVDRCTPVQAMLILSDLTERAKNVKN
ncbi:MAG: DNA mismatch repair protein MutS, partial [Clostridia bacterium]|nr:DNA mismatch repair protein MutS [Clostridia bacterium]